jgi:hypothetical protein
MDDSRALLPGGAQFKQFETSLGHLRSSSFCSQYLKEDHFTHQPDFNAGTCAAYCGTTFAPCRCVHVQGRISLLIGKKRSHGQHFLDPLQGVYHGNDPLSLPFLGSNHEAAAVLSTPNINNHGTRQVVIRSKALNRIGQQITLFQTQYKNAPYPSFAVLHDQLTRLAVPSLMQGVHKRNPNQLPPSCFLKDI